jgi:hypothetical protein
MAGQLTLDHCTLFILELIFFTFYFHIFFKFQALFLQISGFISSNFRLYFFKVMILFVWLIFMLKIVKIQNQIQKLI